jgi:transcriptional regulator with XRE-family HTH domain
MNEIDIRKMIQSLVKEKGGIRAFAKQLKISPSYVSDVCNGRRAPGPPFLKTLNMKKIIVYIKKEQDENR